MVRKIASHYTLINARLERNIVVAVDDSGRISDIIRTTELDSMAGVEFHPGILIPGMVNAHCHLELSYLKGSIAEHTGFAGFAAGIGSVRDKFSDQERIHAASVADAKMWSEGVEAVADIANDDLIMGVKQASKIKYHTFIEFFGLGNHHIDEHLKLLNHPNTSLTPHSIYSVQDGPFREICSMGDAPLSIHFMESDAEAELFVGRGSLAEWYAATGRECDFLHYNSPSRRIVESIPASRRVILVHNTRTTPADVRLIERHFNEAPSWVLCPESNRYISDSRPPVEQLAAMGCSIAIGTDSLSSARHLSMIENLRLLNHSDLAEALMWATAGGARALGMEQELGSIEIGKAPGLVVIEGADLRSMRLTDSSKSRRII